MDYYYLCKVLLYYIKWLNVKIGVVFICVFNFGEKFRLIKRGILIVLFILVEYVSEVIDNCCEVSIVNEENSEML